MPLTSICSASSLEPRSGAKPPSSPPAVPRPASCSVFFSAWKTSAPMRRHSENEAAPAGTTMNSWKSTLLSACAPPLRTFIIGTGRTRASAPPRWRHSGWPASAAAACATASDTPRIALAPRRDLFSVPSSSIERGVEGGLVVGVAAVDGAGDLPVDVGDRGRHALAAVGVPAVAQLGGLELTGRGARRHGGAPGRAGAQRDVDLDRRVAAAVEDLAGVDAVNRAHVSPGVIAASIQGGSRKRCAAARRASSGSTRRRRASSTAAKSCSPTRSKATPPRSARAPSAGSASGAGSSSPAVAARRCTLRA